MNEMVQEGSLQYFLETRVTYDGLERMFNAVWEHKNGCRQIEDVKEHIARATLRRYIYAIDEEEDEVAEKLAGRYCA